MDGDGRDGRDGGRTARAGAEAARDSGIGAGFGRLWTASTAGNLGDGVGRVAVALLAAQLTRDPLAVAVITALSYLPWLVFGVPAGTLVDRYDRRRLAVWSGAVRAVAVAVLTAAAATDRASLWLLYAVVLLLHTGETGYDNAVLAMVPMVVARRHDLERANGRLQGAQLVAEGFLGPPLAGVAFTLAAGYAFGVTAACYVLAVLVLLTLPGRYRVGRAPQQAGRVPATAVATPRRATMRQEMADGLRYLWRHALHRRLLGLMILLGFGAAMVNATTVLWTLDVLGVSEALFGVFTLTMAIGALAGSQSAAAVAHRWGRGRALCLAIAGTGVGSLLAAATTSPYLAGAGLVLVGWANLVLNVVNAALRQRLTPASLLGRVTGTYRAVVIGVMVLGALTGGAVASIGGLRLPWLVFGLICLAMVPALARRLTNAELDRWLAAADAATDAGTDETERSTS